MTQSVIPKDRVFIQNLSAEAVIGVFGWERNIKQRLEVDLILATDVIKAAATDNLVDAVDYSAISSAVTNLIENSHYQLIETLAEAVAQHVLNEFNVSWLKLTLRKPGAVANASAVGVEIERHCDHS